MAVLHLLGLGLVTRKGPERGDVLKGTSLFKPHDVSGRKRKPPRCLMVVDTGSYDLKDSVKKVITYLKKENFLSKG